MMTHFKKGGIDKRNGMINKGEGYDYQHSGYPALFTKVGGQISKNTYNETLLGCYLEILGR